MTQNSSDNQIANQGFAEFRGDLNEVLGDIDTMHAGDNAPSSTASGRLWFDTTNYEIKIRNDDDDAWITLFALDNTTDVPTAIADLKRAAASGTDVAGTDLTIQGGAGTGTGAGGSIVFQTADAGSTGSTVNSYATAMAIDDSGNVGIGTSSPQKNLEIASGNSGGDAALDAPTLRITNTTNSTDWDTGDVIGTIEYYLNDSSGNAPYVSSFIKSVNETGSGTLADGALTFGTATYNVAGGAVERMRIDQNGNVGIGATSVDSDCDRLQVDSDDTNTVKINGTGTRELYSYHDSGGVGWATGSDTSFGNLIYLQESTDNIKFFTNDSESMRIYEDGKVLFTRHSVNTSTNSMSIELATSAPSSSRVRHVNFVNSGQGRGYIQSGDSDSSVPRFLAGSDYRFKTNVTDYTGGYDKIKSIPVKQFDETTTGKTGCVGWIAHEVATVFPDAVEGTKDAVETWTQDEIDAGDAPANTSAGDNKLDDDGNTIPIYQSLASSAFYPDVVQALQKTIEKLEAAEAKIATLETQAADFETRIAALESA